MPSSDFRQLVREDLYRYAGELGCGAFFRTWRYETGFRVTFWIRLCRLLFEQSLTRYGLFHVAAFFHRHSCLRYGVHIGFQTEIGGGLYIPHALGIVVHRDCVIGANCDLSHNVTLGVSKRSPRKGTPVIGDRVYIGPGAVIFGAIRIGDDVAVGANSVVIKSAPDMSVVAGIPGKVISDLGSTGYLGNMLDD